MAPACHRSMTSITRSKFAASNEPEPVLLSLTTITSPHPNLASFPTRRSSDLGRERDLGFAQRELAELQRTHGVITLRDPSPNKHRPPWSFTGDDVCLG